MKDNHRRRHAHNKRFRSSVYATPTHLAQFMAWGDIQPIGKVARGAILNSINLMHTPLETAENNVEYAEEAIKRTWITIAKLKSEKKHNTPEFHIATDDLKKWEARKRQYNVDVIRETQLELIRKEKQKEYLENYKNEKEKEKERKRKKKTKKEKLKQKEEEMN